MCSFPACKRVPGEVCVSLRKVCHRIKSPCFLALPSSILALSQCTPPLPPVKLFTPLSSRGRPPFPSNKGSPPSLGGVSQVAESPGGQYHQQQTVGLHPSSSISLTSERAHSNTISHCIDRNKRQHKAVSKPNSNPLHGAWSSARKPVVDQRKHLYPARAYSS